MPDQKVYFINRSELVEGTFQNYSGTEWAMVRVERYLYQVEQEELFTTAKEALTATINRLTNHRTELIEDVLPEYLDSSMLNWYDEQLEKLEALLVIEIDRELSAEFYIKER